MQKNRNFFDFCLVYFDVYFFLKGAKYICTFNTLSWERKEVVLIKEKLDEQYIQSIDDKTSVVMVKAVSMGYYIHGNVINPDDQASVTYVSKTLQSLV